MKATHITKKEALSTLSELCNMYPNDADLHTRFAERLAAGGREVAAIFAARKAYELLSDIDLVKAGRITDQFGPEVVSDSMHILANNNYMELAESVGVFKQAYRKTRLKKGKILFQGGDPADYTYLILEGTLSVINKAAGELTQLNELPPGALVGEGAMQEYSSRSATVAAKTDATLLRFSPEQLEKLFIKHPDLNMQFAKESMLRRRVATLSSGDAFLHLPLDLRFIIAKRAWNTSFQPADIIKPTREYMPYVGQIASGSVMLFSHHRGTHKLKGKLKAGDILGLHKLLKNPASNLAYVAEDHCELVCVDFRVVEDILDISSRFRQKIVHAALTFPSDTI